MFSFFSIKNYRIWQTFKVNIQRIAFDGAGLTLVLILIVFILLSNIYRVLQNGQNNYTVFKYEKETLSELKSKNEDLKFELEVTSSDEYKRLLAREVLGLATDPEDLYQTKEDINFFEREIELLDLTQKKDYSNWWISLLK